MTTERGGRVCVVGSLHFDILIRAPYLPRAGETLIGERWSWRPGGKGGNQAIAAARHGARATMVGRLGDDDLGLRVRERLLLAGVELDWVRTSPTGSGMSVAIQQPDGDYAAIVVSGANAEIDEEQVDASGDAIRAAGAVLLQNEIPEPASAAAARIARASGALVVLNAAPARTIGDLAGLVDVLVVNGIEAEMLGSDPVSDLPGAAAAARRLDSIAPTVIVTAGRHGAAAVSIDGEWTVAAKEVADGDAHGAGDVFVGALGARLAVGDSVPEALRYATVAASLHVAGDRMSGAEPRA